MDFSRSIRNLCQSSFNKDVIITGLAQVAIMLILFLCNKFLSMQLGPRMYTIYSLGNKSAALISYGMIFCLGIAIPKYVAYFCAKGNISEAVNFVKVSLIFMTSLIILGYGICNFYTEILAQCIFSDTTQRYLIMPICIYAIGMAYAAFLYSIFRAINNFFLYGLSQIIIQMVVLLDAIFFYNDIGTMFSIWGYSMSVIAVVWLIYYKWRENSRSVLNVTECWKHLKEIMQFCIPRVPGEIILFSFVTVPLLMLNHKIGIDNTTGFVVSLMINTMVTPVFGLVGTVLLPYVSASNAKNAKTKYEIEHKIRVLFKLYICFSIIIILFVFIFAKYILIILFSNAYVPYENMVKLMSFSILPNAIYLLLRNPLDAVSKFPFNTINLVISFCILMGVVFYGYSELMYISGFFLAYTNLGILTLFSWEYCKRKYNFHKDKGEVNNV